MWFGYVYGKTYKEVHDKLIVLKSAHDDEPVPHTPCLLLKHISQEWLVKGHLTTKSSIYNKYIHVLEKHILPQLGNGNVHADSELSSGSAESGP